MSQPKMLTGKEQPVLNSHQHVAEAFTQQIPAECWEKKERALRATLRLELKPDDFGYIELWIANVSGAYEVLGKCRIDGAFYKAVMDAKEEKL